VPSYPENSKKIPGMEKLLENKYRLTPQRKSVLLALAGSRRGEHHTAECIYNMAKKNCPQIGLATVYRTLELFCRLSIVQSMVMEDGKSLYELKRDRSHHHLICLSCGTIMETDLNYEEIPLPGRPDFKVISSSVHFFGYCAKCHEAKRDFKERRE
jgi:Fur family ferric uptake transcriptional regulator